MKARRSLVVLLTWICGPRNAVKFCWVSEGCIETLPGHVVFVYPSGNIRPQDRVSVYGLSSVWHQAIIWTNAGLLLIVPLERNKFQWNSNQNATNYIPKKDFKWLFEKWHHFASVTMCWVVNNCEVWLKITKNIFHGKYMIKSYQLKVSIYVIR